MSDELKVTVTVYNKKINKGFFSTFEIGKYIVRPYMITRRSCGEGKAANRYYYTAHFIGFEDMLDIHGDSAVGVKCTENIIRSLNKNFNPKNLSFIGDTAIVNKIEKVSHDN